MLNNPILERVSQKTLLGIRFWDPALDVQILNGLHVTLAPIENILQMRSATKTSSGVYAFNNIPGMLNFENGMEGTEVLNSPGSPSPSRTYVLEAQDLERRFTGVSLLIDLPLPYAGLFLVDDNVGSPSNTPKGFNLYSSITRFSARQYTCVRGELINRVSEQPAAHALVRVQTEDDFSWFGLADEKGRFAIMMPYPFLSVSFGGSPPTVEGIRLSERTWNIQVSVMYEPLSQHIVPGALQPDYSSILSQKQALVYTATPENDAGEVSELPAVLVYGRDLIVKTDGFSELYIGSN
ncbi:MAG: hypothetical protein ACI9Y1_000105 [Lentisphaeria bacterium]